MGRGFTDLKGSCRFYIGFLFLPDVFVGMLDGSVGEFWGVFGEGGGQGEEEGKEGGGVHFGGGCGGWWLEGWKRERTGSSRSEAGTTFIKKNNRLIRGVMTYVS